MVCFVLALTGFSGCGDGNETSSKATAPEPAARGTADPRVVQGVPLRSTIDQVVAQIGPPARVERRRVRARKSKRPKPRPVPSVCYVYRVIGGRPTDRITMCFIDGKLSSVLALTPADAP